MCLPMSDEPLASWQRVWRAGAPLLPTAGLEALAVALEMDDPRLLQGATTTPPPLQALADFPCDGACLLGYPLWKGKGLTTVAEVEHEFAEFAEALVRHYEYADPAPIRWVANWADETPRDEMRREALVEVRLELQRRLQCTEPAA